MARYTYPTPPSADVLFTKGPTPVAPRRWIRQPDGPEGLMYISPDPKGTTDVPPVDYRWLKLLEIYEEVFDVPPALAEYPTPWRVDAEGDLVDRDGDVILDGDEIDDRGNTTGGDSRARVLLELIAAVVNAWSAQQQTPPELIELAHPPRPILRSFTGDQAPQVAMIAQLVRAAGGRITVSEQIVRTHGYTTLITREDHHHGGYTLSVQ